MVRFEDQTIALVPCKRVKSGGGTPVVGHEYSVEWGKNKNSIVEKFLELVSKIFFLTGRKRVYSKLYVHNFL